MYSQLIYFIIALLLLTLQQPGVKPLHPPAQTAILAAALLVGFVLMCQLAYRQLRAAILRNSPQAQLTVLYHRIQGRLNVLVILVLAIQIYVLDVKFYLRAVPGFADFMTVSGLIGLAFYILHLAIIWYCSHPYHQHIYQSQVTRGAFVWGNVRFYLALLIPWLMFSFLLDGLQWIPKTFRWAFLASEPGQLLLFAILLCAFIFYAPWLMVRLWKCQPIPTTPAKLALEEFCQAHRFRLGGFLFWPIFSGDAITAGIVGILPRLRYILMTPAILRLLDTDELQAVTAHEMGHVRRLHIPFYLVFFLGYSLLAYSFNDLILMFMLKQKALLDWALSPDSDQQTLFSLVYSIPIVFLLVLYFRYVFGYFMRNSERQADIYALDLIGHPFTLVSSLEKIAVASGHIHDLPSWHHFSIRQRIEFLLESWRQPELRRRHHRKLYAMATVLLIAVAGLSATGLHFKHTSLARSWKKDIALAMLERKAGEWSANEEVHGILGTILLEQGRYAEARDLLRKQLERSPDDPEILNILAGLYATAPPPYADPPAALDLALKAARLLPEPHVTATLAQAYYANGRYAEALETMRKQLERSPDDPQILNNLAWMYATSPAPYAVPRAALDLAQKAARLLPEPYVLDTLAEAYYANGLYAEALTTIQQALDMNPDNLSYLLEQQRKFRTALSQSREGSGVHP
jgi:Zn-dependent protease with chaperone function/Tfp pilus assembly protein PilF